MSQRVRNDIQMVLNGVYQATWIITKTNDNVYKSILIHEQINLTHWRTQNGLKNRLIQMSSTHQSKTYLHLLEPPHTEQLIIKSYQMAFLVFVSRKRTFTQSWILQWAHSKPMQQ
jgi:hypothetical protein